MRALGILIAIIAICAANYAASMHTKDSGLILETTTTEPEAVKEPSLNLLEE